MSEEERGLLDPLLDLVKDVPVFDIGAALLVFVLFVLGFRRGFVAQVGRLVGFVLGFALARAFASTLAPALAPHLPDTDANLPAAVAFLVILLGGFVVVTFFAFLLRRALEEMKLAFLDRTAGAFLGAATAGVLLLALVLAIALLVTPPKARAFADRTWTMRNGLLALRECRPVLPEGARARLDQVLLEPSAPR